MPVAQQSPSEHREHLSALSLLSTESAEAGRPGRAPVELDEVINFNRGLQLAQAGDFRDAGRLIVDSWLGDLRYSGSVSKCEADGFPGVENAENADPQPRRPGLSSGSVAVAGRIGGQASVHLPRDLLKQLISANRAMIVSNEQMHRELEQIKAKQSDMAAAMGEMSSAQREIQEAAHRHESMLEGLPERLQKCELAISRLHIEVESLQTDMNDMKINHLSSREVMPGALCAVKRNGGRCGG